MTRPHKIVEGKRQLPPGNVRGNVEFPGVRLQHTIRKPTARRMELRIYYIAHDDAFLYAQKTNHRQPAAIVCPNRDSRLSRKVIYDKPFPFVSTREAFAATPRGLVSGVWFGGTREGDKDVWHHVIYHTVIEIVCRRWQSPLRATRRFALPRVVIRCCDQASGDGPTIVLQGRPNPREGLWRDEIATIAVATSSHRGVARRQSSAPPRKPIVKRQHGRCCAGSSTSTRMESFISNRSLVDGKNFSGDWKTHRTINDATEITTHPSRRYCSRDSLASVCRRKKLIVSKFSERGRELGRLSRRSISRTRTRRYDAGHVGRRPALLV